MGLLDGIPSRIGLDHVNYSKSPASQCVDDCVGSGSSQPRLNSGLASRASEDSCCIISVTSRPSLSIELRLSSHSQTTITRHPAARSAVSLRASRSVFAWNFTVHRSTFDDGVVAYRHAVCRCQKQPWTKIATRCFGRTRSGEPGRPRE
jgi:hypothetical protein